MAKNKKQKPRPIIERSSRPRSTPQNRMVKRQYQGADYGRLWNDWLTSSTSANAELYAILPTLRDRCRDLARNDVYAGGAIRLLCDNILGECGFNFQAKVPMQRGDGLNEPINKAIEDLIKHWSRRENCDVRGLHSFTQLERLVVRTWAESGEVLIRKVRQRFGNSKIPYAIQVLEPDYLVEDHAIHLTNSESTVEMGIQIDKWGRVEGYWLYKGHPGDRINIGGDRNRYEIEFVPASEIDHIYLCDRPGQLRGVPPLAIAIKRLHLMGDTEDAELVAAKLAAFVGGVIKTRDTDNFSDSIRPEDHEQADQDATGDEFRNFEPGMFMKLHPDEDAMPFTNNRPNQALPDFTKHIMRGFSVGVGLSYSGVTNDFSDASYSSHRAEKLKEIRSTRYLQNEFKEQFHSPQIREVISSAWLVGAIDLPGFEMAEERYLTHHWLLPAFDWIDPSKDIKAALDAINGTLSTYSIELGKRNLDFDEIIQQRKIEQEKLKKAGLLPPDPEPAEENNPLKEGLTAVRSLLEGQSEEMRTILRQLESAPDVGAILLPLIQRAIDPTPVTVEVISPEGSRDIVRGAKNCKKGKPCGGSCQSKKNVCFVGLSAEQKALALKARKAMASGGGIASELPEQDGGKLAVTSTTGAQGQPQKKTKAQLINEKYASADPSPEDAQKWLDERVASDFEINEENINRVVITEAKDATKSIVYDNVEPIRNSIVDKESFVDAADKLHQIRNAEIDEVRGVKNSQATVEHWRKTFSVTLDPDGKTIDEVIEKNQARLDSNKTGEKAKEKARKKIAKFQAQKEDIEARSQAKAEEFRSRWLDDDGEEFRRQTWGAQFDASATDAEAKFRKTANDLNSDKSATKRRAKEDAEHRILRDSEGFSPDLLGEDNISTAQAILRANYNKNGGAKKYGFSSGMSAKELKTAYKKAASKAHPDAGGTESEFIALQSAYNTALLQVTKYD